MTYLIAELGSTHDGSLGNVLRFVREYAGAFDALKLQDHRWERVKGSPPWFESWGETRAEYLERTSFEQDEWERIAEECRRVEVDLIVSPFSVEAVEALVGLVDGFKVASGQVTNMALLEAIAKTGKPVYLSSGMTTWEELDRAMGAFRDGEQKITVMQCTSEYPCEPGHTGLNLVRAMVSHYSDWRITTGFSDHTLGMAASLAAVTLGATVIERHVTWHRGMYGTDARHSLTPEELVAFRKELSDLDEMLASPVDKDEMATELGEMRRVFLEGESNGKETETQTPTEA